MRKLILPLLILIFGMNLFAKQGDCFIEIIATPGIKVYLNNKLVGTTNTEDNGLFIQNISAGSYALKFVKKDFQSQSDVIRLNSGQVLSYKVKPFKPKLKISQEGESGGSNIVQKTGNLTIQSLPTSIKISIPKIGANVNKKKDKVNIEDLGVGKYSATFTWKQKKLNYLIEINNGQTTHLVVNMIKGKITDVNKQKRLEEEQRLAKLTPKAREVAIARSKMGSDFTNSIGMEFILVEAGTFQMGSTSGNSDGKPVHQVTLIKDYYIGKYEVTQKQWIAVMGSNPSKWKGDNLPVEQVSWNDVQEFITKLNQKEGTTKYRLPTEAQWEYAARGGNKSKGYTYSGSNNLDEVAWYDGNSSSQTHQVGTKKANELGIYDMTGNVWEWCSDWHGSYNSEAVSDPSGPSTGSCRVLRGGSWCSFGYRCRVAYRSSNFPSINNWYNGFRILVHK